MGAFQADKKCFHNVQKAEFICYYGQDYKYIFNWREMHVEDMQCNRQTLYTHIMRMNLKSK